MVRRPHALPVPHHLRPRYGSRPRRRPPHLRRLARGPLQGRRGHPLGAVAAHPEADPATSEIEAIATHTQAYGDIASAPDPTDPGRILLGPLHRHAATGFHLDAVYDVLFVRPVLAAAKLVRFLDREVIDTYVRGAGAVPRWLGYLVRRAQTGNLQTYLSALLAGSVVLAIAAVTLANVYAGS